MKNKKGQLARAAARENKRIVRNYKIMFTSYLMEKGYVDPYKIACFWEVSSNTAKIYMKEAQYVKLGYKDRDKIKIIMDTEKCDIILAVKKHYERLINPDSCFIATAAYGTPFAYDIDILRNWRDKFLEKNCIGKKFIHFYYKNSPPIACCIKNKKILKLMVKILLKPIIFILNFWYKK
jgi:hypothetical protein